MDQNLENIKKLVNMTFGQNAANDEDIVSFYHDVISNIFDSVFVIKAHFGEYDSYEGRIIGVGLSAEKALEIKNNFEKQMRVVASQPAPYSLKDVEDENLTEHETEIFCDWFVNNSEAQSFKECTVQRFSLDKIYDLSEPTEEPTKELKAVDFKDKPQYLVRPSDFSVFTKQENGNYKLKLEGIENYVGHEYEYSVLVKCKFFPCSEEDLKVIEKKHDFYMRYVSWSSRSDGHGGSKGGSIQEYKKHLKKRGIYSTEDI